MTYVAVIPWGISQTAHIHCNEQEIVKYRNDPNTIEIREETAEDRIALINNVTGNGKYGCD